MTSVSVEKERFKMFKLHYHLVHLLGLTRNCFVQLQTISKHTRYGRMMIEFIMQT